MTSATDWCAPASAILCWMSIACRSPTRHRDRLFADLTRAGARNALAERGRGLVGRRRFQAMTDALASGRADGKIVLDLELVYGHCWGGGPRNDPMNYKIDADRIPLRG